MTDPARSTPARSTPRWTRWLVLGLVAVVVLVVLFTLVFPWLERNLSNPTMGAATGVGVMPAGW